MGRCIYCNENAGLFRSKHSKCEKKNSTGMRLIAEKVSDAIKNGHNMEELKKQIEVIKDNSFISSDVFIELLVMGYDLAVNKFLDDKLISTSEHELINNFIDSFNLDSDTLNKNGSHSKVVMATIIEEVSEGKIPERINLKGTIPFVLQKSEKIIWLFNDVDYFEERTKTTYKGGYQGVSLKVTKGVYYRTGAFKGHPVKVDEMKYIEKGILGFTNKHIYFASQTKNFRIRYDKIVAIQTYSDGIGIHKDGVTAKPQLFKNVDSWFVYNLINNINQMGE